MKICASAASHPGNCRGKNEDNFCFNGKMLRANATIWPLRFQGQSNRPFLFGVFDGMGGIHAGEVASGIAAKTACSAYANMYSEVPYDAFLLNICNQANALTCSEMLNVIKQRIGTTASMLLFSEGRYYLCNIGDSPIFLFRENQLRPIFHEHTEKENFLRLHGVNALPPRKKFKLTQNIGIFPEEMEIEPYLASDILQSADRFLICSDGITDMVPENVISEILGHKLSTAKTVSRLLQQALDNGGRDNATIICIDIQ